MCWFCDSPVVVLSQFYPQLIQLSWSHLPSISKFCAEMLSAWDLRCLNTIRWMYSANRWFHENRPSFADDNFVYFFGSRHMAVTRRGWTWMSVDIWLNLKNLPILTTTNNHVRLNIRPWLKKKKLCCAFFIHILEVARLIEFWLFSCI